MSQSFVWPMLYECNCIKRGKVIYCFPLNMNALCKVNIETGDIEMIDGISGENFEQFSLVSSLCTDGKGSLMVCVPYTAKQVHIIDLETEKEIDDTFLKDEGVNAGCCYNVCFKDGYWYIFPFKDNEMLQIDADKKSITATVDVRKQYKEFAGNDYNLFSYSGCHIFQNKIYMVMRDVPTIAEYDTALRKFHFYDMESDSAIYICAIGHEEYIYVLGNDDKIHIWNIKSHEIEKEIELDLHEDEIERFKHSAQCGKYIYLFKYIFSDEFIRINTESQQIDVGSMKDIYQVDELMYFMAAEDGSFYFLSQQHMLYSIEMESKEIHKRELIFNKPKLQDFLSVHMKELDERQTVVISEGDYVWTLENYITRHVKPFNKLQLQQEENIGAIIHKITGR